MIDTYGFYVRGVSIELLLETSNHTHPILKITPENKKEAMDLGFFFCKLREFNLTAWKGDGSIYVPLMPANKINCVADYKRKDFNNRDCLEKHLENDKK